MINEQRTFYYPQNLDAQTLLMNMWNFTDLGIMGAMLIVSILLFLFAQIYIFFAFIFLYAFMSAKIANGYSITKLAVLYCRFLITDKLFFKWR